MTIDVSVQAGIHVVRVDGDLTDDGGEELAARVGELIERRGQRVVLDLAKVAYLNSSGLSALVNLTARANLQEGRVVLAATSAFVTNVLEMTKLTRFFDVCATVDEAVRRASSGSAGDAGSRPKHF